MDWAGAVSAQQNFNCRSLGKEKNFPFLRRHERPVLREVLHTCPCSNSEALSWIRQNWQIKKRMFLSKSACSQAQKLLYSLASLEMPKHVLQDGKIVMEFKVMKSLSPWNKACRFLNSTDTFPSIKSYNPTGTLRRGGFFSFQGGSDCIFSSTLKVLKLFASQSCILSILPKRDLWP